MWMLLYTYLPMWLCPIERSKVTICSKSICINLPDLELFLFHNEFTTQELKMTLIHNKFKTILHGNSRIRSSSCSSSVPRFFRPVISEVDGCELCMNPITWYQDNLGDFAVANWMGRFPIPFNSQNRKWSVPHNGPCTLSRNHVRSLPAAMVEDYSR